MNLVEFRQLYQMIKALEVSLIPTVNHIPIPFDNPLFGGVRDFNISNDPSEVFS